MVNKWIKDVFPPLECGTDQAVLAANQITLEGITSALCLLAFGVILALFMLILERLWTVCTAWDCICRTLFSATKVT